MATKTTSGFGSYMESVKRAETQKRAVYWRRVDNTLLALGAGVLILGASLVAISAIQRKEPAPVPQVQKVVSPVQLRE